MTLSRSQESCIFFKGAKAMLPIIMGVIPFGLVMGTVASNAQLDLIQTTAMNFFVFAGACQLAAVDLMVQGVPSLIVIATGLIINIRFILYSVALSQVFSKSSVGTKLAASYAITDQSYAVLVANEAGLVSTSDKIRFYFGASLVMIIAWQVSVIMGFVFGNFAPQSLALEYAVPLSFVALVMPTLKDRNFFLVALFSSVLSIMLKPLDYNLGLLLAGLSAIGLGALLTMKTKDSSEKQKGGKND